MSDIMVYSAKFSTTIDKISFDTAGIYFLLLIYISLTFHNLQLFQNSVIVPCSLLYRVSLRKFILLSSSALVMKRLAALPLTLMPHKYRRVCASSHTRGISLDSSTENSNLKRFSAVELESSSWNTWRSCCPTSLVRIHSNKQCWRVAMLGSGQYLQLGLVLGRILASLCSVGSMQCSSLHRNVVASEPKPFSLDLCQVSSQSVSEDFSSELAI